jgi:hypothetical protein
VKIRATSSAYCSHHAPLARSTDASGPSRFTSAYVQPCSSNGVLVDQILAWDNDLFREDLGVLPDALQEDLKRALLEFLDLE